MKNTNIKSYLQGGKLGDFIHSLMVCKFNWDFFGYKADLYMANIGDNFEKDLNFTYNDLKPILEKQEWLNSFNIYNNEEIDINLSKFRQSKFLYQTGWLELCFNEFLDGMIPPNDYKWIDMEKDDAMADVLLINRSLKPMSEKTTEIYESVVDRYEKKYFICFDESQYENFTLKHKVPMLKVHTLYDFFKKINGCKLFIGFQSGPASWATAMNVPRGIELLARVDNIHFINDSQYYPNTFDYFQGDNI
jgi:hypothetical protein